MAKDETRIIVSAAVEGVVDEAVLRRVMSDVGCILGVVYGKVGKGRLRQKINGYNQAARLSPWVVLVDLDHDSDCAPPLRNERLPNPAPSMCFRVAVREVESWLLADRERIARFLSVSVSRIPRNSETIANPKEFMVELAKASRRREIREDMVPAPGSERVVGPAYTSRMIEFAASHWQPRNAAQHADSLRRCLLRIHELVKTQCR